MENTIENIWKRGFADEKLVVPPKINNLYSKKSKLLFDKMKSTYKWDNMSLLLIALVSMICFSVQGKVLFGTYTVVVLGALFYVNTNQLNKLFTTEKYVNCFAYIKSLRSGIKSSIKFYNRLLGLAAPIVTGIGFWLYFIDSEIPKPILFAGISVIIIMPAIALSSYHLSIRIIYRPLMRKLDEIIEEMEELIDSER